MTGSLISKTLGCDDRVATDGREIPVHLLYRPGHYDILYPR